MNVSQVKYVVRFSNDNDLIENNEHLLFALSLIKTCTFIECNE